MNKPLMLLAVAAVVPSMTVGAQSLAAAGQDAPVSSQEQRFGVLDGNADRVISRQEAKGEIAENYSLIDEDDSKTVDYSEFAAWKEMNLITE